MKLRDKLYMYPWESLVENNCNSYLIDGDVRMLIDPGHRHLLPHLEAEMGRDGFTFKDIQVVIATHPHPDHFEGLLAFLQQPARLAMHENALAFLKSFPGEWQKRLLDSEANGFHLDFGLREGDLRLGKETLQVVVAPGHAPGSICLYWTSEKALFSGDVVFKQGMGRVDLPGGDPMLLAQSLQKLMTLDVELLLPGHGPIVEGRGAVRENFYMVGGLFQKLI